MDPWLKALQLHRQRKKRTEGKHSRPGTTWEDSEYEREESVKNNGKASSRRFETTIQRPSLDDETAFFVSDSTAYERKRRKHVEGFSDQASLETPGSDHHSRENGRAPNRTSNPEKNEVMQEESAKDDTVSQNNYAFAEGSSECRIAVETSVQSTVTGRQVSCSPQRTSQELGAAEKTSSEEEHQKLLEELRRIEEELEKARAWATT
ncbi:hypothetical protein GpartN1_g773.t1 [Galdieria partita]|uniref:Uncharacterized protein n=1 Tax=Galdieria partita TaxID=83374 RepID=A0A9C7PSR3_9RHOD|nr:hypothetical protein GpartN1_g773.t1 [Galdieria partita]